MTITQRKPEIVQRIFDDLPIQDRTEIVNFGVAFHRLQLEKRLDLARSKLRDFEAKYGATFDQFESAGLPNDADFTMHEDYVEWHYWARIAEETAKTLASLSRLSSSSESI